mmetsp:Transcript_36980/g.89162  ORF Transcript_36980/g.89162 Transcript_36980/m.89162 type:complete len:402 (-) Transcript_36980:64-1269(-)|eukprot:CAMPEP_0181139790 /NCGR_PEP_ID=MMETSP1071-20121207/34968_1 /TAXON_ID=35127 /ORGANISM="Thalassiosira sp., Strain NH16" /LENGTH=401 /DNA_ID=CAMNT_0023226717 /DNA_START=163 /DNA_END=1368 /DNA_ORIENTATION=+
MAALTRATKANYVIHDRISAETSDREDHTFCGIMFPIKCKDILPLDHVIINSISVRGALGPLTVWVTKEENLNGEISMSKKHWTKIYEKSHAPSFITYCELDLTSNPIIMRPGQVRGIYIHSTRRGDEAIVYDNKEKQKTHDDSFITILPGRAHVSEKVFGSIPIWGWGSAWRDNREFVGQIKYGACYRLWNPSSNLSFGSNFRTAARILFMCQRRRESTFSKLPDDCLFFILNMMRWDWVSDTSVEMRREQREARRTRRRRMLPRLITEADVALEEAEMQDAVPLVRVQNLENAPANEMDNDAVLGVDEEDEADDDMEEDSSDDSEDADSSSDSEESGASDEYHWGDHVSSRNAFIYNVDDSGESEDDDSGEDDTAAEERRRQSAMLRTRNSILRFLRSH